MTDESYDTLTKMLRERGIDRIDELLDWVQTDEHLDAAYGACKWWDDLPKQGTHAVGPGLLVKKLQDGGLPGYRHAHERDNPTGNLTLTEPVLHSIRRVCTSPDGVRRAEIWPTYTNLANKLNLTTDELIDAAMGPGWTETPPHPASCGWDSSWEKPDFIKNDQVPRYHFWITHPETNQKPDWNVHREPGETDWMYARRFWRYSEPQAAIDHAEKLKRIQRQTDPQPQPEPAPQPEPQPEHHEDPGRDTTDPGPNDEPW